MGSPLPPHLAALLSSRIDRYRRIQPALGERLEQRLLESTTPTHRKKTSEFNYGDRVSARENYADDGNKREPPIEADESMGASFQEHYLKFVLENASGGKDVPLRVNVRESWDDILRVHTSGCSLTKVILQQVERMKAAASYDSAALKDLRAVVLSRQVCEQQVTSSLQELGGPADLSRDSKPSNGWFCSADVDFIRREAASLHAFELGSARIENQKLEAKIHLYQVQMAEMEKERSALAQRSNRAGASAGATTEDSGSLVSELRSQLRRSERQREEGQEVATMLRALLKSAMDERDGFEREAGILRKNLEAAVVLQAVGRQQPWTPTSPAPSASDLPSASRSDTRSPEPTTPGNSGELSELERALHVAGGLLDEMEDESSSHPKRLTFSPTSRPLDVVELLSDTADTSGGQPRATAPTDTKLMSSFAALRNFHLIRAAKEQRTNRMIAAHTCGLSFEQWKLAEGAAELDEADKCAWTRCGPGATPSSTYTNLATNSLDHMKLIDVIDDEFIGGGTGTEATEDGDPETNDHNVTEKGIIPCAFVHLPLPYFIITVRNGTVLFAPHHFDFNDKFVYLGIMAAQYKPAPQVAKAARGEGNRPLAAPTSWSW